MSNKKAPLDPNIKIKIEPGTSEERLASFKLPRDLTLGGSANRGKRTFTPNLNVVRKKDKGNEVPTSSSQPNARGGRGRGRGNATGRGGRGRRELIQSQGVFSEGMGNDTRRGGSWGSRSGGGGASKDDSSKSMEKPKVNFKQEIRIDKNVEDQTMEDLLAKRSDNADLEPDYEFGPVTLSCKSYEDIKIKIEKTDDDEESAAKKLMKFKSESQSKQIDNLMDLLESEKQKFVFFQFPDSLPGFGIEPPKPDVETNNSTKNKRPASGTNASENTDSPARCTLNDLGEGMVGKIVMYKSGRAKLILGTTEYNIELGMQRNFLQDVMSIETTPENTSGKMINLGQIEGGIVVSPDWNYLLNNIS